MKIYVIEHKFCEQNLPENYQYLFVGARKNAGSRKSGVCYDDSTADNISAKNANYCELTGLYWIWKATKLREDIVGLVHYRRFFTKNRFSENSSFFLSDLDTKRILDKYDIIIAERIYVNESSVAVNYANKHYEMDWKNVRAIIETMYPNYLNAFDFIAAGNWYFPYNMMIARKSKLDEYSEWLFPILNKLENISDLSNYSVQQARIYGYISERLLAVWILGNGLKYYEAPVIQTGSRVRYRFRRLLEKKLRRRV